MFVTLGVHQAMRMNHIFICGLLRSTIFVHLISQKATFSKITYLTQNMFLVPLQIFSQTFFIVSGIERDMTKMYIVLHVKYPLFFSILMKLEFSRQILKKP